MWASSFASNTVTHLTLSASVGAPSTEVTLRGTGDGPVNPGPIGMGVTDGSVAGTGHVTFTGAINDNATFTGYRSVKGRKLTLRWVSTTEQPYMGIPDKVFQYALYMTRTFSRAR